MDIEQTLVVGGLHSGRLRNPARPSSGRLRNPARLIALLLLVGCGGGNNGSRPIVMYCAQDRDFAERVLGEFTEQTGLAVSPKYDTEANKSVGLYQEIVREANRPRCDLYWNNEPIATLRLHKQGLLAAYDSPDAKPFPDWAKADDQTWFAFAARARVLIVNTEKLPEADWPKSLLDLTQPKYRGQVVMAKPFFGTTATHAACLFETLGSESASGFFRGLIDNKVQVVAGNKQAAEVVGRGEAAIGLTDTDDAMLEINAEKPVAIIFPDRAGHPDHPKLGTLYLPNTLALIKGAPQPASAQRLLDFLLSPSIEQRLAEGGGYQIPLNPNVKAKLPPQLLTPQQAKPMTVDFGRAADRWDEVQTFLRGVFGG